MNISPSLLNSDALYYHSGEGKAESPYDVDGAAVSKQGLEVWTSPPEAFGAYIKTEYEKWGRIIQEIGISAN